MNPCCVKRVELRLAFQIGIVGSQDKDNLLFYFIEAILHVIQYEMLPSSGLLNAHFVKQ